jgi:hypothetical protein
MMQRIIGINEIKTAHPDEWILLGNPEIDEENQRILSGILLYHSPDKREVCYIGKTLAADCNTTAMFFNRVTSKRNRSVIASLFYPVNK